MRKLNSYEMLISIEITSARKDGKKSLIILIGKETFTNSSNLHSETREVE